jgi:predicted translin family RNA/ssDNA-binding protein
MEENNELVGKIKDWIQLDTEINQINNTLKDKKKQKKELTDMLLSIMKSKDIEVVKLNDGSIEIKKNKVKKAINKNHLLQCLSDHMDDVDVVKQIVKNIFDKRDESVKESISRRVVL